jgi:hypothetical protein
MTTIDFRQAPAADVAQALDGRSDLAALDLRAAVANALNRIASLEHDRDELEQVFKAFNETMEAAKLHGPGVLNQQ